MLPGVSVRERPGVEQSWEEAVRWYRAAAEQGLPRAQCNLAWCYEYGKGVPQDLGESYRLYRKAAEQGDARGLSAWPAALTMAAV